MCFVGIMARKSRPAEGGGAEEPPTKARKMSIQQKAHNMTYDHLKDWIAEDTDVRTVAGDPPKTLRKTLMDDIRQASDGTKGSPTFGKRYYEEKRLLFRRTTDPLSMLEPEDPDEAVNPKLLNAMVCVKRAQPDRSAFTSPEWTGAECLRGLWPLRLVSNLNPANFDHLPCAFEVLRFVARNKVHTSHPKVAVVVKPWFDEVPTAA